MIDAKELYTTKHETCVVCGEKLYVTWTDLHGQAICMKCGMTYTCLQHSLTAEFFADMGIDLASVVLPCPESFRFLELPIAREYWQETHRWLPFGSYMSDKRWRGREDFVKWLYDNRERLRPQYEDVYKWDVIIDIHEHPEE